MPDQHPSPFHGLPPHELSLLAKEAEELASALESLLDIQAERLDAEFRGEIPQYKPDCVPPWAAAWGAAADTVERVLPGLSRRCPALLWVKDILNRGTAYYAGVVRQLKLAEDRTTWWEKMVAEIQKMREACRDEVAKLLAEIRDAADPGGRLARPASMSWKDAAERMERLRTQGEPFSSQQKLAEQLGCSSGTINKAITRTPSLKAWAKPQTTAAPRAQSINDVVTDRTAQSRELNPVDQFAIREYLEREDLKPEERAFFNSLSQEAQLAFLDDSDRHQKILGRKP